MLRDLETNTTNYDCLLRLQAFLVARIRRTEREIARLKNQKRALNHQKKTGRLSKAESLVIKERIASLMQRVADAQQRLFVWRCFGDGIPFLYLDKYALKHMLYNTQDYAVKPPAGALLNKEGFKSEWSFVRQLVAKQVPAVLCDITNTLRHGDVCALIGPDPLPLEVKSSSTRGLRAERQITSLHALSKFLETDEATNFRGLSYVKRVELADSSVSYGSVMNECMERSRATGISVMSPETGLTYVAIRSVEAIAELDRCIGAKHIVSVLNEAVTDRDWMPYYPFTLSIRDPRTLADFIKGSVVTMVALDTEAVTRALEAHGLQSQFVEDARSILVVSKAGANPDENGLIAVSKQFFGRLFYEFGSIKGFADSEAVRIQQIGRVSTEMGAKIESGELEMPDDEARGWPEFTAMKWRPPSG